MKILSLNILLLACLAACTQNNQEFQGRIDTHIHLYDTEREGSVLFLDPIRHEKIYFPHLPSEFIQTAGPAGIGYAIAVEASMRMEDNDWLIKTVNSSDAILACIVNMDPRDPNFEIDLKRFAAHEKFRGIRIRPSEPINLTDPEVVEALGNLEELGLALELGHNEGPETDITAIARMYPDLNIIIDHIAGLNFKEGVLGPPNWKERLTVLSSEPNVFCKISALFNLAGLNPAPLEVDYYLPLIDPVVDAFGPERIMFGSNWTLSEMGGSYTDMILIMDAWVDQREDLSPEQFYTLNALNAFGIKQSE